MKKPLLILFSAFISALLLSAMPAAAPDTPTLHSSSVSLLQEGELPLPAPLPKNTGVLMLFRTGSDIPGATEAIRAGFLTMEESIDLSSYKLSASELKSILQNMINASPELFHVNKQYSYYTYAGGLIASLVPSYNCTAEEYAAMSLSYEEALSSLLSLHRPEWTAAETVIFYHDYFALHYEYDTAEPLNYDAYSFLTEKNGVCQAYTLAFTAVMNRLNIPCTYAQSESMVHIWNLIQLDGSWYHVDVTWDDPVPNRPGQVYHNLLLLSDEAMQNADHYDWVSPESTVCSSSRYDSAAWKSSTAALVWANGGWYGFDRGSGTLSSYSPATGKVISVLHTITEQWTTASGNFYVNKFSGIAAHGGMLFFNTPTDIYGIDLISGQKMQILSLPEQAAGNIYNLYGTETELRYTVASDHGTASAITDSLPYIDIAIPDLSYPVHLYSETAFLSSHATISSALSAMNDPSCNYSIVLFPAQSSAIIPFNTPIIQGGVANTITIRPASGYAPVTVVIGSSLQCNTNLHLENVTLISSATSATVSLFSNTLTLSGKTSIGTDAAVFSITGDEFSSIIVHGEQNGITLTGSATAGSLELYGDLVLRGQLTVNTVRIPASSKITFPKEDSALSAVDMIGSNELSLLPTSELPPAIEITGIVDILLNYHYPVSYGKAPLLTAPSLPAEDIHIFTQIKDLSFEVSPLFPADENGTIALVHERLMNVQDGTLTSYLSILENDRVEIPSSVTSIAPGAFLYSPNLQSVLIPASVTSFGEYSVGYIYKEGSIVPLPDFTLRIEEGAPAVTYAQENALSHTVYRVETNHTFIYRYYPQLALAELIAWQGTETTLLIPSTLRATDETLCTTSVDGDLASGRTGLTIFSPFPAGSPLNPYADAWGKSHTYYPLGAWFTLSLYMENTLLRSLALPAGTDYADDLITPAKPAEPECSYQFLGWDMDGDGIADLLPAVLSSDLELHAVFERLVSQYVISWYDDDGALLMTQTVDHGALILPPLTPVRDDTVSHTYRFLGWTGYEEGLIATTAFSFYAVYEQRIRQYTYQFLNDDGTLLSETIADYGTPILLPPPPEKPADEQYVYTFSEWLGYEKNLTLTSDISFTAVYIKTDVALPHPSDITSDQYQISLGYVNHTQPSTQAALFLSCFNEAEHLRVIDRDGNLLQDTDLVGTGMTVALMNPDGTEILKSLTVVIVGDVSGDGLISDGDFLLMKDHLLGINTLSGAASEAADLNGDGTASLTDFIRLKALLIAAQAVPNA